MLLFKALAIHFRPPRSWLLPTFAMLFACATCVAQKVTINLKSARITALLDSIQRQTKILLVYSPTTLADAPLIDLDCRNVDVREVLNRCFAGLQLGYIADGNKYSVYRKVLLDANLYTPLEGRVQNADGEPLEGASITVDSIPMQITRSGGLFRLPVRACQTFVTISFLGYSPRTIQLSNHEFQVVSLQRTSSTLDQVVVQPYGKTTARLAAGSIAIISQSDISAQPTGDVSGSLDGRVPGMVIQQSNGVPGSAYSMLIRGRQSIAQGTNPLIVVDDVPIAFNNGLLSTIGIGSAQGANGASNLNGIPLSAIASIEVLKGAAATAIYGSRGSNGVLLLTLQTGAAGKIKWDVNLYTGVDQAVPTSPLLNTQQYLAMRKQAVENDGLSVNDSTVPELYLWDSTRYTNFKKMVTGNTRMRTNAQISVSGGDTSTTFILSGSYHGEAAVFPGASRDDRMSLYGQLHHQSANRLFHIDLSVLYSWENNLLPIQDYTYFGYLSPNAPAFLDSAGQPVWSSNGITYLNIPALEHNTYHASVTNQFNHLQLSYDLLPGLVLRASLGYFRVGSAEYSQQPISGQNPTFDPTGQTSYTGNSAHSELVEGFAEYTYHAGGSRIEAVAGVNWQDQLTAYSAISATGYTSDLLLASGGGHPVISTEENRVVYRYEAIFGRVNYVLDDRYIATVTGRRDGSSQFGPGNQYGNFWAVDGGWIFSEEALLRNNNWLSFGKLRSSIGTTGNDQIGYNSFAQVYSGTSMVRGYQGLQGVYPTTLANNDLRWELNYNWEVSLDLGFLQNKMLLSATAYWDWTANQLVYSSLASQSGLPSVLSNIPADIVNKGLEFSLQTYNWSSEHFHWTSTFSLTVPVNRLARFPGPASSLNGNALVVGKSLSVVKGYHYEGVNDTTGLYHFWSADHSDTLTSNDIVVGGNLDVRYYGGCNQSLRYKEWQLDLYFEFRIQHGFNPYVTLYQLNPPGFAGSSMLSNAPVEWLHRWQHPRDHATLQQVTENNNTAAATEIYNYISSDAQVTDASFVRWKSMTLSYRLPQRWLSGRVLQECRFYVAEENLLTWTHFPVTDPETQNPTVLPPVRTLVIGMGIKF